MKLHVSQALPEALAPLEAHFELRSSPPDPTSDRFRLWFDDDVLKLVGPTPVALIRTWLGGITTGDVTSSSAMDIRVMLSGRVRMAVDPLEMLMTLSASVWTTS